MNCLYLRSSHIASYELQAYGSTDNPAHCELLGYGRISLSL